MQYKFKSISQSFSEIYEIYSYEYDSAKCKEKFVVSSGLLIRMFGYLDRRCIYWAIEPTVVGTPMYYE